MRLLLLFISLTLAGGAAGQITGTLRTPAGQPVSFANVVLLRAKDSATVRTAMTDSLGHYRLTPVARGSYFLRCSSIGYRGWESPVFGLDSTRDMGVAVMPEDKQDLGAVVVQGRPRPVEQTIEGTIVHAESSILTKGSSMLEVLERSPGVQIDQHNNTITLNGKNGVTVMINGKTLQLPEDEVVNMLASMPADNLDRLELLTTPPAKYDASGNAGMINIVLKKGHAPGTNGSFTLGGGWGGIGEKGNASAGIDHNSGKIDWYGSYAFTHDRTGSNFRAYGSQIVAALGGPDDWTYRSTYRHTDNNHSATAGLEARPGHGFTVGASVTYNFSGTSGFGHNVTIYTLPPDSVLSYDGTGYGYSHWNNTIVSLHAERTGHNGGKLGVAADWIDYANNRPTHVVGSFVDSHGEAVGTTTDSLFSPAQLGFSTTGIRVGVGKIDYSKPLGDRWRFEAGVKGTYTTSSSRSGIESLINGSWVTSLGSVDAIAMHEGIGAGYTSVHAVLTSGTTLDLGVRYEYSRTRLADAGTGQVIDDRKLGVFFPNLLLSQKLGEHSQLQLSYSKRITRPSYKDLSSYLVYNDPLSVISGNPLLRPTITNNLKLGYTNNGYAFSMLLSRDDNPIIGWAITAQPGSQLIYIRPENLRFQNYLTFEANLPFKVTRWWEMSYDLIGGWRRFGVGYLPVPAEKTYFGFTMNFRETFRLPAAFTAELSGFYNGADYYGPFRNEGYGSVNVGLKKQLRGNRGSVQFSAADVLESMNVVSKVGLVGVDAFYSRSYMSWNAESRQFPILKLTYSRSFGSGQKTHNDEGTSGEERARIK
jgi:iron complex outermembrane receptor protein